MIWPQFRVGRLLIVGLYLVLVVAYGVIPPAFESPDELLHFDYVETLLRTRRLPVAEAQLSEYHQSPLYYVVGALSTAWLPPSQPAASAIQPNPFWAWRIGEVGVDNKSQFVHGPEQAFPYTGLWLRLHLLRVLTALLGLAVVWLTGELALLLWPERYGVALMATAFVAFLPQFLYLASSVSNDIPAVVVSALALVVVGRFLDAPRPRRALVVGIVLGCAILTKMNLLIVWALASVLCSAFILRGGWEYDPSGRASRNTGRPGERIEGPMRVAPTILSASSEHLSATAPLEPSGKLKGGFRRRQVAMLAALIVTPLLISAPYLWRNWLVYGDPTALSRMDAIWGRRQLPMTLASVPQDVHNTWTSFWARFGYGQLPLPNGVYDLCLVLTVIAMLGVGLALAQWASHRTSRHSPGTSRMLGTLHSRDWLLIYSILLVGAFIVATLRYAQTSYAGDYGRFVFPALPAIAVLLARGWDEVLGLIQQGRRYAWVGPAITSGAMLAFGVWALFGILRPAYVLPTGPELPAETLDQQPGMRFGDVAILRRVVVENPILQPGADMTVEVEWLPLRRTPTPLTTVVRLRGPDQVSLGERHSYPGLGRTSTTFWTPGRPFVDRYRVPVEPAIARQIMPAEVWLEVGLYDQQANDSLPVSDWPCGREINPPLLVPLKLSAAAEMAKDASPTPRARFGDSLQLIAARFPASVSAGTELPLELNWGVLGPLACEYKLFLHLVQPGNPAPLAQADGFLGDGRASGTMWAKGQAFEDRRVLPIPSELPAGRYQLVTGIYNSRAPGQRLPANIPGQGSAADSLVLGEIQVVR